MFRCCCGRKTTYDGNAATSFDVAFDLAVDIGGEILPPGVRPDDVVCRVGKAVEVMPGIRQVLWTTPA
jgi:hypothetical protein